MDTIDELRAIKNIYEVKIDGVWYVDMTDFNGRGQRKG